MEEEKHMRMGFINLFELHCTESLRKVFPTGLFIAGGNSFTPLTLPIMDRS